MASAGDAAAQGEQALREVARILEGANIIVRDLDGLISHWTQGCEELYGWTREEAIGRRVHDLLKTEFPEAPDAIAAQMENQGAWSGELVHQAKDGRKIWVSGRWVLSRQAGRADAVVETNTDISDLKHTQQDLAAREAHLQSILATVPEAMVVIDERGTVTSFSAAAEALFGYDQDEVCGKNVRMLMPSPDREAHDGYLSRYLTTGERRIIGYGRVVTGLRKEGTTFPMELAIGEAFANGRRVFTGFIRDLTSRHKMEEEHRQLQKMEAVGQLTGGIAHDFNNLLTVISGNLEMLERHLDGKPELGLLREAQDAADEGAKLTGQLLAFGRRQPLNPKAADIGSLVTEFSSLLRRTLGETIELRTVVSGANHVALVDASQFQNAMLNLALNARDAMPRGGKLIVEISRSRIDSDYARMHPEVRTGAFVLVSVTDTGVGMTPDVRDRAFEPFFTTKDVGAGTGLGLSMVYGFAKQSGGHLQIYSEPGRGASVRLFLPATTQSDVREQREPATPAGKEDILGGSETILVAEDDLRVRRVVVARLTNAGYRVLQAGSAADALKLIEEYPDIDLLFTDIMMPGGMMGDELAARVKARWPRIKILFTSGYAEPMVAGRELAEQGQWLKKPYTAKELTERLRELLD